MNKKGNNALLFGIGALLVSGFFLLGFNRWFDPSAKEVKENSKTVGLECLPQGHVNLAQHFHPHLTIVIDGVAQTIPASVGITPSCMSEIHMHDTSGKIHIESVLAGKTFTLGQFFSVWGNNFSEGRILDRITDESHEIIMTVDGVGTNEFETLVLRDNQEIVIEYREKGK